MAMVQPSFQLIQVEDMFLDSHVVAQIFGKGHDVTRKIGGQLGAILPPMEEVLRG